ncbi:MAG: hypothetical protein QOI29_3368 [Mycobacterium sp.]|nr:hypothetical protein [Mycobacterium sp.]
MTSLTDEAHNCDSIRRLFSAVHPVVSPEPPEGPVQAQSHSYGGGPTPTSTAIPAMETATGPLGAQ